MTENHERRALNEIDISVEGLRTVPWQEVISSIDNEKRDVHDYMTLFSNAAQKAREGGNYALDDICSIMYSITSFALNNDEPESPFQPIGFFQTFRTPAPEDLSTKQLDILAKFVPEITDAELRARVSDVAWTQLRRFNLVPIAVKAYIESSSHFTECQPKSTERIERALRLALLTNQPSLIEQVAKYIDGLLADKEFLFDHGLSLLRMQLDCNYGNPKHCADLSEEIAVHYANAFNWHRTEQAWSLAADWHRKNGNDLAVNNAIRASAECLVSLAKSGNDLSAASAYDQAIRKLRAIPDTKDRIDELHQALLQVQAKTRSKMKRIESPKVNISTHVKQAREAVKGKTLDQGLRIVACDFEVPCVSELRENVRRMVSSFSLSHLVTSVHLSASGKRIANRPSMLSDNPKDIEAAEEAEMFQQAAQQRGLAVLAFIHPARQQLLAQNHVRERDLLPIVSNRPFVPVGRERLFAKGLYLGLTGDYITAAHMLAPQLENSLRHLLELKGRIVSSLTSDLIQNELTINQLLDKFGSALAEILGSEDLVFDLRGFLAEKTGSNFRHDLAHGLLADADFEHTDSAYLWWLVLNLVYRLKYQPLKQTTQNGTET